jgi:hypothetical protein
MTEHEEIEKIEAALDAMVSAVIADENDTPFVGGSLRPLAFAELMMRATPAQRAAFELLESPVRSALRAGIVTLGERLKEIGGLNLLHEVALKIEAQNPAYEERSAGVLSKAWVGLMSNVSQGG